MLVLGALDGDLRAAPAGQWGARLAASRYHSILEERGNPRPTISNDSTCLDVMTFGRSNGPKSFLILAFFRVGVAKCDWFLGVTDPPPGGSD